MQQRRDDTQWRRLRMGMVGGGIGSLIGEAHRIAARIDGGIDLVAGCFSQDFEKTKLLGRQLGIEAGRLYPTFEAMVTAESELDVDSRIDFVAVLTPNHTHLPIAQAFLKAGFHVLCDKPVTATLEEALQLKQVVDESGRLFGITYNYPGSAMIREARRLIAEGAIGELRRVVVEYFQGWLSRPLEQERHKQADWRTDPVRAGVGGSLGDIGTHALNLLEYVTGDRVAQVAAECTSFGPGRLLDDDASVLIRMSGGARGTLSVSQIAAGERNNLSIRLYGTEGHLTWRQEEPDVLIRGFVEGPPQRLYRGSPGLGPEASALARIPPGHPEGFLEAFANVYRSFAKAVAHAAYPPVSLPGSVTHAPEGVYSSIEAGVRGLLFATRVVESSKQGGGWVFVSE
ncbi:MAG: Gfo/Idh/MocA family protein [Spirochaetota bacterium]